MPSPAFASTVGLKCIIRQVIVTKPLFKSLKHLTASLHMSPWWHSAHNCPSGARACRTIIQLLLNKDRHTHTFCYRCDVQARVCTPHILFQCTFLEEFRTRLWHQVEECGPPTLIRHLNCMPIEDRCSFVLNGFYTSYTAEWSELYQALATFVYSMIIQYDK